MLVPSSMGEPFGSALWEAGLQAGEFIFLLLMILLVICIDFANWRGKQVREWVHRQNGVIQWCTYGMLFWMIILFGIYGVNYEAGAFIYSRF